MSEVEKRCGNCRRFDWFGERNASGERVGYCPEFPAAGKITENCVCRPSITFRPKAAGEEAGK